ncbi:hypothetical protein CDL15_Pgr012847 [Punica granatum]|uniref:AAA+ ATPase domain-containing protein n=1 Tax=Punica granatum TaxID=22663 RepID=A0A218XF58_PUNGR|nr:hypothetical protein CDL15_Pgr012847 [Punica granatum]
MSAAYSSPTHAGSLEHMGRHNAYELRMSKLLSEVHGANYLFPALLAGIFGVGTLETVFADAGEIAGTPLPAESPSSGENIEEIARKERERIEELLKSKGIQRGSYPRFGIAVKGQKVTFKFQVPPACEISHLIANLVSNLGVKAEENGGGADMLARGWDSAVAWQLTLNYPHRQKEEIEFIKPGSLTPKELEAFVSVLQLAGGKMGQDRFMERRPREGNAGKVSPEKAIANLESMGVRIYGLDEPRINFSTKAISWDNVAGYDQQKREIEDTILLALQSPEVYDDIARGTRSKFESNRPRAVLFEGPPGTGKTSCARVIATQAGVPLLYVPLEVVMSKYYGESERLLGQVFSLANDLPEGAIIFLDEVDSFAVARDSEMHEATRRILSVLLRQIDGFEQDKKVVVIAATNRKQDLDPALISRFDSMINFGLPDQQNRREIAAQYAKHLTEAELAEFAAATQGMSGRDIRDVCQQAERSWASKIIRGQAGKDEQGSLPPLKQYIDSALNRRESLLSIGEQKTGNAATSRKRLRIVSSLPDSNRIQSEIPPIINRASKNSNNSHLCGSANGANASLLLSSFP